MNEVEKMYKTIFGEFAPNCSLCAKIVDCKIFNNTHNCNKFECNYERLFTAEKQLEIVKMILFSTWWINLKRLQFSEKFDEGLAQMINDIWQSLTEVEKAQIKEILE